MTPRQRRVMRKAIKMAKAGQREIANARAERCAKVVDGLPRKARARKAALTRAHRALDLLDAIDGVHLYPAELAWIQAIYRRYRHEDKRKARRV